jgi:transcription initiation factor TFIID subunit TAF12
VPVFFGGYYGGYPYYYDPSFDSDYQQQAQQPTDQQLQQQQQVQQPQQLQIIVRDKRDEAKEAAANEAAVAEASQPRNSNLSEPPHDPAIFIFKDGSRKELGNFAIMSGMLYDLSDNKVHKYPLNTIDRNATLAANAQAGREINLP